MILVSIHIEPNATAADQEKLLRDLRSVLPAFANALVIFMGDFNFAATGDQRLDVASGKSIESCDHIARKFDEIFGSFAEIHQEAYTRREQG